MAVLDPNHYAGKQLPSALIHVSFFKLIVKNPDVAIAITPGLFLPPNLYPTHAHSCIASELSLLGQKQASFRIDELCWNLCVTENMYKSSAAWIRAIQSILLSRITDMLWNYNSPTPSLIHETISQHVS